MINSKKTFTETPIDGTRRNVFSVRTSVGFRFLLSMSEAMDVQKKVNHG